VENGVEHHFTGLSKKVHCPVENFVMYRLRMDFEVLKGVPFFKKKEPVFILKALAEVAALASLFLFDGIRQ
jgi:hypothetical protein